MSRNTGPLVIAWCRTDQSPAGDRIAEASLAVTAVVRSSPDRTSRRCSTIATTIGGASIRARAATIWPPYSMPRPSMKFTAVTKVVTLTEP